jgi:trk system potassium uptake protein TrkH
MKKLYYKLLTPERMLLLSWLILITIGTSLLMLPISTKKPIRLIDAIFTITSASCVTGLTVVDIGKTFTYFGQIVTLAVMELGGIGIMTFSVFFWQILGIGISLKSKLTLESTLSYKPFRDVFYLAKQVILIVLIIQSIGTIFLTFCLSKYFPFKKAIYVALYHCISAFTNCGFSIFSDNLIQFQGDVKINLIIMTIIVLGGIGFIVIMDFKETLIKNTRLSLHSKVAVITTLFLILIGGSLLTFILLGDPNFASMPLKNKILVGFFHSISARTCGLNTVDIGKLNEAALFLLMALMFIGASPGSCGGGIKTVTFAVLMSLLYNRLKGREEVILFKRVLPPETVSRAVSLVIGSFLFVSFIFFLCLTLQVVPSDKGSFHAILFEVVSAFGTVGLSTGITPYLNDMGKIIIIITMLVGRLGFLTMSYALIVSREKPLFKYAEEDVMVG